MTAKENNDTILKVYSIKINTLIQRGGGTGPMKPGNRLSRYGAKSCRIDILEDERDSRK
jgi:hypothetical protein